MLGQALNAKDGRTDGVAVANALHRGLETGLRAWFYDRVFRGYNDVPLDASQQATIEFQARNEVGFFQAVETAFAAKRLGHFKADLPWVVDWLARLTLGVDAAAQAFERRGGQYANSDFAARFEAFAGNLSAVLPDKSDSFAWVNHQVPLLATNCLIVAATAFGDSKELEQATRAYSRLVAMADADDHSPPAKPAQSKSGCGFLLAVAVGTAGSGVIGLL